MRKLIALLQVIAILLVLAIFTYSNIYADDKNLSHKHKIDFSGILIDSDLFAIKNAELSLTDGENVIQKTKTNDMGEFTFKSINEGIYLLEIILSIPNSNIMQALIEIEVNEKLKSKKMQIVLGSTDRLIKANKAKEYKELDDKKDKKIDDKEYEYSINEGKNDKIVVTGTLTKHTLKDAPVRTTLIDRKKLDRTSSNTLADVLNYSTGVRTENNCQNCNFNQVRLNGLEGPYTQVLIDGMPLMTSLAGVYGLEQIPSDMIEKVEIVKGGASSLYSGSAIGGVINVITKVPEKSFYLLNYTHAYYDEKTPDIKAGVIASNISDDKTIGGVVYGSMQYRQAYFHDDDEFSEVGRIRSSAFGTNIFFMPFKDSKLSFGFRNIKENRRGGDNLQSPEHESMIAESSRTDRYAGTLAFEQILLEHFSYKVYTAIAFTDRNTYYGAEQDLNAYGRTENPLYIGGVHLFFPFEVFGKHTITVGSEYKMDKLKDEAIAYERKLDEEYENIGGFIQEEYSPIDSFKALVGARFDKHSEIDSMIISPRASLMYNPVDSITTRLTASTGYRPPMVFDEDLHITQVNGESQVVVNDDDLKEEKSYSLTGGVDYEDNHGDFNLRGGLSGFYTILDDLFVLDLDNTETSYVKYVRKNNDKAKVYGGDIELGFSYDEQLYLDLGMTLQKAEMNEPDPDFNSKEIFRTPHIYGYFVFGINYKQVELVTTGLFTGPMKVPHITGEDAATGEEIQVLEESDSFMELGVKLAYNFRFKLLGKGEYVNFKVFGGIKNLLNSYQDDFDTGVTRDAGYTYGPRFPRTYYFGSQVRF